MSDQLSEDNNEIGCSKELARGPLGRQLSRYPLRFATSILIGPYKKSADNSLLHSATLTLVDLGRGPLGITCDHVLTKYQARLAEDRNVLFQIGGLAIDPLELLIDRSPAHNLDLVTLNLEGVDLNAFAVHPNIGSAFFDVASWPPDPPRPNDYVAFGGFPGLWRSTVTEDEIGFATLGCGACRVDQVKPQEFVCVAEGEFMVQPWDNLRDAQNITYGGLSGSPVFRMDKLRPEFVGILFEALDQLEGFRIVKVCHAGFIEPSGRISREVYNSLQPMS